MARRLALAVLAAVAIPGAVSAQIYVGRDASGSLLLSDRPVRDIVATYAVAGAPSVRATRPASAPDDPYADLVDRHASRQGVRPDLVRAVIQVESGYNRWARSPKGAQGLMQLMPATAAGLGVEHPYDPEENIRGGVAYLRALLDRFQGDEELALAAYNAGPAAVDRYGQRVPPFKETRDYVTRVRHRTGGRPGRQRLVIYRTVELVDGREVPRYSNVRPVSGDYEVVGSRR